MSDTIANHTDDGCLPCRLEIREMHGAVRQNTEVTERLFYMIDKRMGQLITILDTKVSAANAPNKTAQYATVGILILMFGLLFGSDALTKAIAAIR